MIKYLRFILFCICAAFLISCGGSKDNGLDTHETPSALEDDKLDVQKYSRSGDLVDELYSELVTKSAVLKNMDDDLKATREKSEDLTALFVLYNNKSVNYYRSANNKVVAIKDSVLRNKMILILNASKEQYRERIQEYTSLLDKIGKSDLSINDRYAVLKILLTFPLMEKYQKESIPDTKQYKEFIQEQNEIITRLDSLTTQ